MCHGESLENVVEKESLSQTRVDMTNTKKTRHLLSVSTKTVEGSYV